MPQRVWIMPLLLAVLLLAAACGPAATEGGVTLATVPVLPTHTPAPTEMPAGGALPVALSTSFLGIEVSFNYPAAWRGFTGAQYVVAFDENDPRAHTPQPQGFPQVGAQVRLLPADDRATPDAVASRMLFWQWYPGSNEAFLYTEQGRYFGPPIPETQRVQGFRWGMYDAAIYTHTLDQQREDIQAVHIAVQVEAPARYAVLWLQAGQVSWRAALPVMQGILETVTINGTALPPDDLLAALSGVLGV